MEISYRADLQVLAAAQAGAGRRWLIDVRRRFNPHQVGAQRMVTGLLPHLGPALGGRSHLAHLMALVYLRAATADSAFPAPVYFEASPSSVSGLWKKTRPSRGCAPTGRVSSPTPAR